MPTGGGKSITFQVPALMMPGLTIVVTPLISLMKDQVDHLRHIGILAYAIHSGMSHDDIVTVLDNCIFGTVKFLYVSPERIASPFFLTKVRHMNVSFITVDEAHCISQWGYDFRPAYLQIARLREHLASDNPIPILALTATATPDVVTDIQQQLHFREGSQVFRMSFRRENITYVVRRTEDKLAEILHILDRVTGSAIIYTMSRGKTKDIARELDKAGIAASYYHAGLDIAVKTKRQADWQEGRLRVIVATNAFGMGIDKPDVRIVIHADIPSSIEAYFQEAGRAGRDGQRSYAVLLVENSYQRTMHKRLLRSFPPKDFIRTVYDYLAYYLEIGVGMGKDCSFIFHPDSFQKMSGLNPAETNSALHILSNAGYIHYEPEPDTHTRVMVTVTRETLNHLDGIPTDADQLLVALLRTYTGIFADYVFIDESYLAMKLDTTPQRIYMLLTYLRQRRIISFVPPRTEPRITYLEHRVPSERLIISSAIYDNLYKVLEQHLEAIEQYITTDNICRQVQLVRYFGEENAKPCRTCDVCVSHRAHKTQPQPDDTQTSAHTADTSTSQQAADAGTTQQGNEIKDFDDTTAATAAILALLNDGKKHPSYELRHLPFQHTIISKALDSLMKENKVGSDITHVWMIS